MPKMAEKPTKIVHRYESWRGTAEHLAALGRSLAEEFDRAKQKAKEKANIDLDNFLRHSRVEYEQDLRTKAGLQPGVTLSPDLQLELASEVLRAETYREQRRAENEQLVDRGTRLSFGYTAKSGHSLTSSSPEFSRVSRTKMGFRCAVGCSRRRQRTYQ